MAVLLQANGADEIEVLTKFEAAIKRLPWKSALAMGVLRNGHVTFGYSSRESKAEWAVDSAVKACSRNTAEPCTLVMQDGALINGGLQALAAKLGQMPQTNVRRRLVQTLQNHALVR